MIDRKGIICNLIFPYLQMWENIIWEKYLYFKRLYNNNKRKKIRLNAQLIRFAMAIGIEKSQLYISLLIHCILGL